MVAWLAFACALFALASSGAGLWVALATRALPAQTLRRLEAIEVAMPAYRVEMKTIADHCEQVLESTESKRKRWHSKGNGAPPEPVRYGDLDAYKAHLESGGRVDLAWEQHLVASGGQ